MRVDGQPHRTIWLAPDGWAVEVIDQTRLPHHFHTVRLESPDDAARAIHDMVVRGAPLIGAAAAYGVALALHHDPSDASLERAAHLLLAARPTAVNLGRAVRVIRERVAPLPERARAEEAYTGAAELCEEDVRNNRALGEHGLALLRELAARAGGRSLNVLTHCNAGWLATVDWGTATAPVYLAHRAGLPVHVWVTETRPRNQGALTTWELGEEGVPHTYAVDNAAGHLMRMGRVDVVLVGTDRTLASGDVCNKIGTYLLAAAARDCGVPFYAAVPGSSIDWETDDAAGIPIEERDSGEVSTVRGWRQDELGA
ncbi:MAG TPA: S-methyl-5-thioribose-1-phosphate isomerase, partial [Gemmatimonadales bacterium]|nr:S-methyl-5-thioribose-1-phosphate isomerase [Gemmatimonadales bacterium]